MADLEVTAENKVSLSGQDALTVEALAQAAKALTSRGVPDSAELTINSSMSSQRWTIVAKWEPEPGIKLPVDAPPYLKDPEPASIPVEVFPCYRCQLPIVADGTKKTGYRHQDASDAGNHYTHAAIRYRPIRDNPQA